MTDLPIRFFRDDTAVRRIGEGLLNRTLPRAAWTHEAHLAATLYLLTERPDIDVDAEIGNIIRGYNAAVGGINDDHVGYHDTITRAYLAGIRAFVDTSELRRLIDRVNALLASPVGGRDWPMRFYSRDLLFSVPARRGFVTPDIGPLPGTP